MRNFRFETVKINREPAVYYHITLFGQRITFTNNRTGLDFGQRVCIYIPTGSCSMFCSCKSCRISKAIKRVESVHSVSLYGVESTHELSVADENMQNTADEAAGIIRITIG